MGLPTRFLRLRYLHGTRILNQFIGMFDLEILLRQIHTKESHHAFEIERQKIFLITLNQEQKCIRQPEN